MYIEIPVVHDSWNLFHTSYDRSRHLQLCSNSTTDIQLNLAMPRLAHYNYIYNDHGSAPAFSFWPWFAVHVQAMTTTEHNIYIDGTWQNRVLRILQDIQLNRNLAMPCCASNDVLNLAMHALIALQVLTDHALLRKNSNDWGAAVGKKHVFFLLLQVLKSIFTLFYYSYMYSPVRTHVTHIMFTCICIHQSLYYRNPWVMIVLPRAWEPIGQ